ncbi:GMC family oxidoreductase N-terminal domain-containing protein [Microbispora corallina]|uniref:Dehydrogenase n=1 Tax=Microbispora corallina TaxID=83302 RepID=A0ABQ4G2P6_9ACTN|nr:mycofactocin system GMC family oxidoreductase MftG [Microbispora corallina]GIH41325.1 dehydrogenase [Microbispora corallina]
MYTDIIIGAGSAGAVVAARLSEDPRRRVLLLEAGPDYPDVETMPEDLRNGLYPSFVDHDWGFRAEAVPGREIPLARGKVVGGSSAINTSLAVRPRPADFAEWSSLGVAGWTWQDVLPYFNKLEDDRDFGPPDHGKGGPIPVWRWRDEQLGPLQVALREACVSLGYPETDDHNAPDRSGVGPLATNQVDGLRISTAIAYLGPARERDNLEIRPDTLVDRILVEDGRAVGVVVRGADGEQTVRGDRIVLSAGAVATPAVLMRSGIGPAETLRRLGVPVVADLPGVGANLKDHPTCLVTFRPRPGVYDESLPVVQIMLQGTYPGSDETDDMQIYVFSHVDLNGFAAGLRDQIGTDKVFMISAGVERPFSVGHVTIESVDPAAPPRIVYNFFDHPEDRRRMREGIRLAARIARTPYFRPFATGDMVPSPEVIESDEALDAFMRATVDNHCHPMGTARMGSAGDPDAVVDERCRVRGVDGLTIADASVIPVTVRVNTNLTCIMIGERVADWLRADQE